MPIGLIVWPEHAYDSIRLLRAYMLAITEQLPLTFGSRAADPILIVRGLLDGTSSEKDRQSALAEWWKIVDERGIQNFKSSEALIARLAICLLYPSEDKTSDLGEQLSWFLEVLGFLKQDVDKAIKVMKQHFEFS
jgi:hypothetical protein